MNRAELLEKFGIIPWVLREPGQEAQAMVLRQGQEQSTRGASPMARQPSENKPQSTLASQTNNGIPKSLGKEIGSTKVARPSVGAAVNAPIKPLKKTQLSQVPKSLSLLYAQVSEKLWLVAECDDWDQGSQKLFDRLVKACLKLTQGQEGQLAELQLPELQWFFWPLRFPALLNNNESNLRQALRGWVQGRKQPGTLWVSLGRRFVDILIDDTIDSGQIYEGRSGMSVVWFSALPALQIEPAYKAVLWQFLQNQFSDQTPPSS